MTHSVFPFSKTEKMKPIIIKDGPSKKVWLVGIITSLVSSAGLSEEILDINDDDFLIEE